MSKRSKRFINGVLISGLKDGSSKSVYIGDSETSGTDQAPVQNEVVIGDGAVGSGSNTVTIGNEATLDNYFSGNITASGDITAFSDISIKHSVETIEEATKLVCMLRGVNYIDNKTDEAKIGLIAQEVKAVLPQAVKEGRKLSVAYGNLVALLIEAIKEQESRLSKLEREHV
jgi:hypothetical protein